MRNLIIAILLAPAAALAGGYVVPNINARDMAMGGAAQAVQEDAAATYANPAALSKLDGFSFSGDLSLIDFRSTWSDPVTPSNPSVTMTPKGAFPPALYAAYGTKLSNGMPIGVGLGLTIPGGGYVFWPGDWPGRFNIVTVDRKVYGTYLTAGIQVNPMVRVGGGLVYYRTTEHLVQGVNFLGTEGQITLGTVGGALSYDLSAEVKPFESWSIPFTIGFDYKHQGPQTLTGHAHATGVPASIQPRLQDQGVTHGLTYPNQLNLAAAYQVIEPLTVTFDWTWERFHVYKQDLFVGDRGVTVVVPRDYRNGFTLRLGGEFKVNEMFTVRAGVLHDTSPSNPDTLDPTLPDADSIAISAGVGVNVTKDIQISAAYFYDKENTISTSPVPPNGNFVGTFQGAYDTRTNIFALSVTWRPSKEKKE
jgi:long-chain fatty acid transport protein